MEEQSITTAEVAELTETLEPQADQHEPAAEPDQTPQTPEQVLSSLMNARTGQFDLKIKYADLKYLKNTMQAKVEWTGPNEAYLVIMTILTLSNALESLDPKSNDSAIVKLPASTFETLNYFLNKISGTGLDGAQKLFSATMILRPTLEAIKKLDKEIELLKNELEIKTAKSE